MNDRLKPGGGVEKCFSPETKGGCNPSELTDRLQTPEMQNKVELAKINAELKKIGLEFKVGGDGKTTLYKGKEDLGIKFFPGSKMNFVSSNGTGTYVTFSSESPGIDKATYSISTYPNENKVVVQGTDGFNKTIETGKSSLDKQIGADNIKRLKDLGINVQMINGFPNISKDLTAHSSTLGLNGSVIPNGKAISFDNGETLVFSNSYTDQLQNGNQEVANFQVLDRSGKIVTNNISVTRFTRNDGVFYK